MKNEPIKPTFHGTCANPIKMEPVYMTVHYEGQGTEESPIKEVKTFFSKDCEFLGRIER